MSDTNATSVDETTENQADDTETNTDNASEESTDTQEVDGAETQETESEDVDYEAEVEKLRKQLGQAEHVIEETKKENKELKSVDTDSVASEIADKAREDLAKDAVDDILDSFSDSPEERELIKLHYENTIQRTGFSRQQITEDVRRARLLANEKKILKTNDELRRALSSKEARTNSGLGSGQPGVRTDKPTLSEAEKAFFRARGKDPDRAYLNAEGDIKFKD